MGSPSSAQRGPLPEEELDREPEELASTHPGKEGKDIHPSFILSFLQHALFEPQPRAWPCPCPQGSHNPVDGVGGHREAPNPALGVVRAGFLEEVAANSLEGE